MIGPLVAVAYLQVGWRGVETQDAILRTLALVVSAAALAAYAHIINDTFDIRSDRLAGKPNRMARFSARTRAGLIACAALAGLVPWFWISLPASAAVLLGAIYVAPWIYSAPPVRLKEHEVGGPLTDAANAFVLPSLFTIALFAPLGPAAGPEALLVISTLLWSAGRGIRSILIHQITDAANDRASGTWTLIARIGPERATRLMRRWLFPVEVVGQLGLLATVWFWSPGLVLVTTGWGVTFHGARLVGVLDRRLATTRINEGWNLYWWQIWPALGISVALALDDASYLALTALAVVLFAARWAEAATTFAEIVKDLARRSKSRLRRTLRSIRPGIRS
jgi:1,4-dihydroxy-2-naphthoate octaprenyltransferase